MNNSNFLVPSSHPGLANKSALGVSFRPSFIRDSTMFGGKEEPEEGGLEQTNILNITPIEGEADQYMSNISKFVTQGHRSNNFNTKPK